MEWVSFIPSVIAGGMAGVFIARSHSWNDRHTKDKQRWEQENQIARLEIDSLRSSLNEYKDAYYESLKAYTKPGPIGPQGPIGPIGPQGAMGQPGVISVQKILADLAIQPKTHVIQEEP